MWEKQTDQPVKAVSGEFTKYNTYSQSAVCTNLI